MFGHGPGVSLFSVTGHIRKSKEEERRESERNRKVRVTPSRPSCESAPHGSVTGERRQISWADSCELVQTRSKGRGQRTGCWVMRRRGLRGLSTDAGRARSFPKVSHRSYQRGRARMCTLRVRNQFCSAFRVAHWFDTSVNAGGGLLQDGRSTSTRAAEGSST